MYNIKQMLDFKSLANESPRPAPGSAAKPVPPPGAAVPRAGTMLTPPSAYADTYAVAREHDPQTADNYVRHLTVGDSELDPVMMELADLPPNDLHRFVGGCIERRQEIARKAPKALRDFFDKASVVPAWVDFEAFKPGMRAFHRNMTNMLIAYALGSAAEGFSTTIAKVFAITGRVSGMSEGAKRRLRQNNRHMVEIYYPDGLMRDGDGWKISMRIRFIHARVRQMMRQSDTWDAEAFGVPLNAAHLGGISLYTFSVRQFEHAISMGSRISQEERDSIVSIWRYDGHLLGVPESILFRNEQEARRTYEVGHMCEPPPDEDSITLSNVICKVIPAMAGIEEEKQRKSMEMYAYRLSRALIGNSLADHYRYPNTIRMRSLVLLYYRLRERARTLLAGSRLAQQAAFSQIFDSAQYDHEGVSYKMPDHVRAAESSLW